MTAFTGVAGLLLGFFGVPALVTPPTAHTVTATTTATVTATATATVTAAPAPGASGTTGGTPSPRAGEDKDVPLIDIAPLNGAYGNWEVEPVVMGGERFDNAITTEPGFYEGFGYSINEHYESLTVTVGLDDDSAAFPATVTFTGGEEGEKTLKSVSAQINRPVEVTVDLTGVAILRIEAGQADGESTKVALGDPVLHRP
ncbi:NPCBM/NEW2 domain-containing protein [Streptomyces sp. NPDC000348]|uniref:NPCBM/NEW2 domain-containing protein n=1 Tax=Streptomyces sp. NPDC000348 TaxID=3364538 RepID=UPI0036B13B10